MGNEMGNNNASGFREEENLKAEALEKSLLKGGGGDEVADAVNGHHRVTEIIAYEKEEGEIEACKPAEIRGFPENSTDRNEEDSEIQKKPKEDETMEPNSKKNRLEKDEHKHENQASNRKEMDEGEKGSNLNTGTLASDDPKPETVSNLEYLQQEPLETEAESFVEDSNEYPRDCENDVELSPKHANHQASGDLVDSKNITNRNGGIGTDKDVEKEEDGEREQSSNLNTRVLASYDSKSDKIFDLKCIQNDKPKTEAEWLDICLNLKYEENGLLIDTDKSTNVDQAVGAGTEADEEKGKNELIEPKSCHECMKVAAEDDNIEDGETATDLVIHNSSSSQPDDDVRKESPKSAVQVPEVEEKCSFLIEESQLKENPAGIGMIDHEDTPDIPTKQFEISNRFQAEFKMLVSDSENDAVETLVPRESSKGTDEKNGGISEQGIANSTLSVKDCKNGETGKMADKIINSGHEAERRESEESLSQPVLGFQSQVHLQENSNRFQTVETAKEDSISLRQETEGAIEEFKRISSDYTHYIQTTPATSTETKPSTKLIDGNSARALLFSPFGEEDQESPGRTSNESNSDDSIRHIEMRKSPSFNIDIKSEGRAEDSEKIPLLYQIKTIEDLSNLQEISFPTPMEKRVVTLGRSVSHKSNASLLGFAKAKEDAEIEITAHNQEKAAAKKAEENLTPVSAMRKGKRRSKSSLFGNCICCATATN